MTRTVSDDARKALDSSLQDIRRKWGEGAVIRLGDREHIASVRAIPTGALNLDLALGVGGVPRGRVTEVYGPESSGKTTLALHLIANAQKEGGLAAFIDAEHALDVEYAAKLGVQLDDLLVSQPDSGEQALEILDSLISSNAIDIAVVDSVAALVPQAELQGEMGDSHVGLQARLMSQGLRKIAGTVNRSGTSVLFTNQIREKVGVHFGSPETTSGGRALKFYSSVRLDIRRIGQIKQGSDVVGNRTRVKCVKNKCAPPFRMAEFDIEFSRGISEEGVLVDMGAEDGVIDQAGAWFNYNGIRLAQGRDNAKAFLADNPDIAEEIREQILEGRMPATQEDDEDEEERAS